MPIFGYILQPFTTLSICQVRMSSRLGLLFLLLGLLPLLSLVVGREEEEAALQGAVREEEGTLQRAADGVQGVLEEEGLETVVKREAEPGRRKGDNRKECKEEGGEINKNGKCVKGRKRNGRKQNKRCKEGKKNEKRRVCSKEERRIKECKK